MDLRDVHHIAMKRVFAYAEIKHKNMLQQKRSWLSGSEKTQIYYGFTDF